MGIIWKKHIKASPVSGVDSDRVCAIIVESSLAPMLIIGVYLPTTDCPSDDFCHCLHTIEDLVNKHNQGPVIIAGDFNAHVGPNREPRGLDSQNHHGKFLMDLVINNDLFFSSLSSLATGPAHTYSSGNTKTTTDYIIVDAPLISKCSTLDFHPLNSSDHLPLSITLLLPTVPTVRAPPSTRLDWPTAVRIKSTDTYAAALGDFIRPLLGRTYNSTAEIDQEVHLVSEQILRVASLLIPTIKQKRLKKRFSNNSDLRSLSSRCKAAWSKWCLAGHPREGPEFDEKKKLKKLTKKCADKCRANLERHSLERREKLFKTKDPRRFRVPSHKASLGERLFYNGEIISDPSTILSCWTNHFQTIFQSKATSNTDVTTALKELNHLEIQSRMICDDIVDDEFSVEEIEGSLKKLKPGKMGGPDGLQPEHLKYGGPLLVIWPKQIFCAFVNFEHVPPNLLTGIIRPIYKGKGKDPLCCHSYRGITMTSVIMKVFEYTILDRILPVLQENGHPSLVQTAYRKHISCQDAIFATQEAIYSLLQEGRVAYLSLYDLEKAFNSIEHPILLRSLFQAGVKGKSWRLIKACYCNLSAVVKPGRFSSQSSPFPISRGVQQGSVTSPTFFLMVMDQLLHQLLEEKAGVSICNLFLGGAAHADDVRAIASSSTDAEIQGKIIADFSSCNGLTLNCSKTEVVKISRTHHPPPEDIHLTDATTHTVPQAKCLGYLWSDSLSCKPGVKENISRARKQFFALGASGCFLGYSNPLSAREIIEVCVFPTLLYGAENWILDESSLNLLECFQAELGRRVLKLSKFHSRLSVLIGLSWPSMTARVFLRKLSFLCRLLSANDDSIAHQTFRTIAGKDVYSLSLIKQCVFLDSRLGSDATACILNDPDNAKASFKNLKKTILECDKILISQDVNNHQSVSLAKKVNWLRVWESARDKGQFWTKIAQSFYKVLTTPLFQDRQCWLCNNVLPPDMGFIAHLANGDATYESSLNTLLTELSSNSELTSHSFHCMKSFVYLFKSHNSIT